MAHVAAWKKTLVQELAQEMIDSPVVAIVDVHGIGGQQIQSMRAGLRGHAIVKMAKNNLILLALEKAAESKPELKGLEDKVYGQCAVVSTDINPFKLFKKLRISRCKNLSRKNTCICATVNSHCSNRNTGRHLNYTV